MRGIIQAIHYDDNLYLTSLLVCMRVQEAYHLLVYTYMHMCAACQSDTHTHVRACTRCPSDVCTYKIVPYYFVRCSKYYCLNPKNKFSNYLNLTSINNYLLLKFEALIFMASNQVYGMYTHKYVTNVSPE